MRPAGPGAHEQRSINELVAVAVIGHRLDIGSPVWVFHAAGHRHDCHGAPSLSWRQTCRAPPTEPPGESSRPARARPSWKRVRTPAVSISSLIRRWTVLRLTTRARAVASSVSPPAIKAIICASSDYRFAVGKPSGVRGIELTQFSAKGAVRPSSSGDLSTMIEPIEGWPSGA